MQKFHMLFHEIISGMISTAYKGSRGKINIM